MAVHKDFHRVEIRMFHGVGRKYRIRDLVCQFRQGVGGEITLHFIFAGLVFRQAIHLVIQKQRLFHSLFDQIIQFVFCGGSVDVELGVTFKAVVIGIYRDDLITGVGTADSFQLALYIEALIALFPGEADLVIADTGIGLQGIYDGFHPNFTFTFSAGPPSLTRTHSL